MKLLNIFRKKRLKAKMYMLQDDQVVQVDVIKPVAIVEPKPKKKREHHKLTREEMWVMMCDKHKFLRKFHINPQYMNEDYIKRDEIWDFFVELELNTSSKLTDKQKEKIKREIVDKI